MSYTKTNYKDVDAKADAMYFLRDELGTEKLGITVIDTDNDWEGMEHDHAEDEVEEVYLVVEGEVTVKVEGEKVSLEKGEAMRLPGETERKLFAEKASKIIAVSAP